MAESSTSSLLSQVSSAAHFLAVQYLIKIHVSSVLYPTPKPTALQN